MEWSEKNKYCSFNSYKGLTYYSNYKAIVSWMNGETNDLPPPVECNLDPIAECNLKCYFCITQGYLREDRRPEIRQLPFAYMYELVTFLSDWGVKGLCISGGGEPTLHPETPNILSYANQRGMETSIFTNGTLITDAMIEPLLGCRWVALSVNAADVPTYERITRRNYFAKVISNIAKLSNHRRAVGAKVDLCFKMLLLPENVQSIHMACKLAKGLGVQDFHVRPADSERKDAKELHKFEFDKSQIEDEFAKCHEEETNDFHVYTVTHKFDPEFHVKHDFEKCLATPLIIPILTDGNAYLCVDRKMEPDFKLGSCYPNPESILDWWGSDAHRQMIKNVLSSECTRCTWGEYNRQIENVALSDKMCLSFP